MIGVAGNFLYGVKSNCLQPDLLDHDVATFLLKLTESAGSPWRTVPQIQVTTGKGRSLLHWLVAADEAPASAVYWPGTKQYISALLSNLLKCLFRKAKAQTMQ